MAKDAITTARPATITATEAHRGLCSSGVSPCLRCDLLAYSETVQMPELPELLQSGEAIPATDPTLIATTTGLAVNPGADGSGEGITADRVLPPRQASLFCLGSCDKAPQCG